LVVKLKNKKNKIVLNTSPSNIFGRRLKTIKKREGFFILSKVKEQNYNTIKNPFTREWLNLTSGKW